jgi:hypothetical protein
VITLKLVLPDAGFCAYPLLSYLYNNTKTRLMKKPLLLLFISLSAITFKTNAQVINPGFETWTPDFLANTAMNPNAGNNTFGWWDFNYFNNSSLGSSPISVTRVTDTVHGGSYAARVETKAYTPTSWNMYRYWGIPYIGHEYNDTLGILFNGKVNVLDQTFAPGTPCTQKISQYKFYYQYRPNGADTAECRVALLSSGTLVAGGVFKTGAGTGTSGWQQATVNMTYISTLTPDTMYVLFSASSLDHKPKAGSVLWIDDVTTTLLTGVEDLSADMKINMYPNPSNGVFSIEHKSRNEQKIEIFNVLGEQVHSGSNATQPFYHVNLSGSAKGIYFVRVTEGSHSHTQKIIVQ